LQAANAAICTHFTHYGYGADIAANRVTVELRLQAGSSTCDVGPRREAQKKPGRVLPVPQEEVSAV